MKAKLIKTENEYEAALAYIETLMDAEPGSPEEAELELFAHLVEKYEDAHYPVALPDPVEAIKFRMDQGGLTRKDMRQYLGSQSKVSEVLNYKRPLSLAMIRSLHTGLGIPAEVLLQEPGRELGAQRFDYREYPFTEMFKQSFFKSFQGSLQQAKDQAEELLESLFAVYRGDPPEPVYCRNSAREVDQNALMAWQAQVLVLAQSETLPPFSWEALSADFTRELVRLSYFSTGPQLAVELLNKIGVHLVILPHLPRTYLDGGCSISPWDNPVIGMTLRYDRLDHFWFTLLHELAHLNLHMREGHISFFDETEPLDQDPETPYEQEANQWARDHLIPPEVWHRNSSTLLSSTESQPLAHFADDLRISQAIVAGRVRWEGDDYTRHSKLVGRNQVRELFEGYGE